MNAAPDGDGTGRAGRKRPVGTLAFGSGAAALVGLEAAVTLAVGALYSEFGLAPSGVTLQAQGVAGVAAAILLVLLSVLVYVRPRNHTWAGIGLITVALLSLGLGGGWIVGAVLGWVAGILSITFRPAPWYDGSEGIRTDDLRDDPVIEADLADAGLLDPTAAESAAGRAP